MKSILLAVAAILPGSSPATDPVHSLHRTSAMVVTGDVDADGTVWFTTWSEGVRFVLDRKATRDREALWNVLAGSRENQRSVDVTFDAARARANDKTGTIDLPICSVRFEEMSFTSTRKCVDAPLKPGTLARSGPLAVAVGWAEIEDGSLARARDLLNTALSSNKLTPAMQVVALRARARANDAIANDQKPATEFADHALIEALADNRRLIALEPNDVEFRFAEAFDLEMLGDYAAAKSAYGAIITTWPDEKYRVTIRRAAVARLEGQYQQALDLLNGLFAEANSDLGMKFYYHRGWTLSRLGRFDEAVLDFTTGMKTQGDYASAYMGRACAYAASGHPGFAIGDFQVAIGLYEKLPDTHSETNRDIEIARQGVDVLTKAVSSNRDAVVTGLCDGFWFDNQRKRSTLLPPG